MTIPLFPFYVRWVACGTALIIIGLFIVGEGQRATSSPPPHDVDPSGLILQSTSTEQLKTLKLGLDSGVEVRSTYATESTRHEGTWYVGARLRDANGRETTGVWLLTGTRSRPALLLSVDAGALATSTWPAVRQTDLNASPSDSEVMALASALRPN